MFKFEMTGLDKLEEKFKAMEKQGKDLLKENYIPLSELFNDSFMNKYTNFSNFNLFLEKGGFEVETDEDFKKISREKLDKFIKEMTGFKNWNEMKRKAVEIYVLKKLDFN